MARGLLRRVAFSRNVQTLVTIAAAASLSQVWQADSSTNLNADVKEAER
jgi:hypothetical protein